jgi:hypothetical protein
LFIFADSQSAFVPSSFHISKPSELETEVGFPVIK